LCGEGLSLRMIHILVDLISTVVVFITFPINIHCITILAIVATIVDIIGASAIDIASVVAINAFVNIFTVLSNNKSADLKNMSRMITPIPVAPGRTSLELAKDSEFST
jgi:hypothetical protein